ncbi:hypothetical protein [Porphyrobacter sp. AAP60]|uniref:hypothetical protein n=1 Tax=Porphyrobacter sp. AAP60 TaxID=1523423 RepID=UPI0012E15D0E|nr:hypothetical protein [Porphyrobacter sp. AAP60]
MTEAQYGRHRDESLPWGYWLRHEPGFQSLRDEEGRTWESIHHYLWQHRLRMKLVYPVELERGMAQMLVLLLAVHRRNPGFEAIAVEVFDGDRRLARHFRHLLESERLIDRGMLTPEGRAVLRMLELTQSPDAAPIPVDVASFPGFDPEDPAISSGERDRIVAAHEAFARGLRFRFIREPVVHDSAIKLVGLTLGGPIPFTRVIWSMEFKSDQMRDRMFRWLCLYVDRWEAWANLVIEEGATDFTEHLLKLRIAEESIDLG